MCGPDRDRQGKKMKKEKRIKKGIGLEGERVGRTRKGTGKKRNKEKKKKEIKNL